VSLRALQLTSFNGPVVNYLRTMEIRCVRCQVRQAGTCRKCQLGWCTLCQQDKEECDVCSAPLTLTTDPRGGSAKSYAQRSQAKGTRGAVVTSVYMHKLGESFVEKVSDVRRRATVDGKAAAPGESLEFLAHIRGWQSKARRQRRDQLLQLGSIGLRVALEGTCSSSQKCTSPQRHQR
jgi:hypothetical protein